VSDNDQQRRSRAEFRDEDDERRRTQSFSLDRATAAKKAAAANNPWRSWKWGRD
jgi:hypothetical protein